MPGQVSTWMGDHLGMLHVVDFFSIFFCLVCTIAELLVFYICVCLSLQEIQRREKELEASVKKPAEATKYQMQTLAEAQKYRLG